MRLSIRAVIVALALVFVAAGSSATKSFNCNSDGKFIEIQATQSLVDLTLMWTKGGADNDFGVFQQEDGVQVLLSIGITNRFEAGSFGAFPGVIYDILVVKASGPNSKCLLNVGEDFQLTRGKSSVRVRDLGNARDLARSDPKYKRMLDVMRAARERKTQ